ncbi:hypothetical protein JCM10212_000712 [Sporobolomyces blumeae]
MPSRRVSPLSHAASSPVFPPSPPTRRQLTRLQVTQRAAFDCFAQLPAELLEEICDLVQSSDQPVSFLVSKSLSPFLHRGACRYLRLVGRGANRLAHLARYAKAHPADLASTLSFFCGDGQAATLDNAEVLFPILSSMPNVRSLTLTLHAPVWLPNLLYQLPHPERLTDLGWIQVSFPYTLEPILPESMANLGSVTFGGNGCRLTYGLFHTLRRLPLHTLIFEKSIRVDLDCVRRFVTERTKHPSLRRLVLNHVEARPSTLAREVRLTRQSFKSTPDKILSDWQLPDWQDPGDGLCVRANTQRLISAANIWGLDISGTAVDALEIEAQFQAEKRALQKRLNELRNA